jgi:LL-H family phage holin
MNEVLSNVLQAVLEAALPILVSAAAAWVIGKVVELVRKLKDTNPELYEILKVIAERAVSAAEQIWGDQHGEEKKAYALNVVEKYLAAKGITLDLDIIDGYIEAAVCDMNLSKGWFTKMTEAKEAVTDDESDDC